MNQMGDFKSRTDDVFEAPAVSPEVAGYLCRDNDGIWVGIEKCIDNGQHCVFVTDASGKLLGRADMADLRRAIAGGAHLSAARMGDFAQSVSDCDLSSVVTPLLDADGKMIAVDVHAERSFLPVAEPDLTHRELRNLMDAFLSNWISSTGDYIRSLEQRFADKAGVSYGVATSNGTVSLQLALAALGIGAGDEVIVPDFTFAASANAVIHAGARPVLVDVDPETWCLSPEIIEAAITPRTRAVMPVHVFGRAAPMTEIAALARSRGIYVIEDCAEAHGAHYDGKPVGSFSDVASYSFFANKIITTGEGGMCVTNDADLAARMRMLRDHGMRPERRYWHDEAGFNFRMTNMQAAIGCAQIDRMDELLAMRRSVSEIYEHAFKNIEGVWLPTDRGSRCEDVVWFCCARVDAERRAALIDACKIANIDLRPFFNGLSSMPAYRPFARPCPNSTALGREGVNLPTSRRVTPKVAARIAAIFQDVLARKL
ncbi:MAG: DegT/DnrJ/EryC1/StrS family aminotransferase [Hyphomicrobium sp.]|nr:DegT/DnrJ/EryC1/StrS family aminotransferase [Hyphomicrobium sp.]